jgi:hypothetical protein
MLAGSLDPVTVTAIVSYQDAMTGYSLMAGISESDTKSPKAVSGIAMASPSPCINQPILEALCVIKTEATSGRENLEFKVGGILDEIRGPGNWSLDLTAELLDSRNNVVEKSLSSIPFTITVSPILLTVAVPKVVIVSLDGVEQTPGPISTAVSVGQYNTTIPAMVSVDNSTRLRFDRWADGFNQPSRLVSVKSDETFEAVYVTQHRLTITDEEATAKGTGWYDEGTTATISIASIKRMSGLLGMLGGKLYFQGWIENGKFITNSTTGTISMNQPRNLTVLWQADYTTPFAIILALGVAIIMAIAYSLVIRKKKMTASAHRHRRRRRGARESTAKARPSRPSRR